MIALDGQLVPGYNMKINAKFPLPSSDDSGMGSFGFDTDTGNKPKILIIRCLIPFSEAENLQTLTELASEEDENGARKIFTVNSDISERMKIRQVKFHQELTANEDEQLRAWQVKFQLKEQQSVPEAKQKQTDESAETNSTAASADTHQQVADSLAAVDGP